MTISPWCIGFIEGNGAGFGGAVKIVKFDTSVIPDAVFGVKESLVISYTANNDPDAAKKHGFDGPFFESEYDFVMKDDASVIDAEAAYNQRASMSA